MLAFSVSFYAGTLITDAVIAHLFARSLRFGEAPPGICELCGCYAVKGSKILFVNICTLIFQETVILSLTLHKAIKMAGLSRSKLIKAFYQVGTFYYISIVLISVSNIMVLTAGPVSLTIRSLTLAGLCTGYSARPLPQCSCHKDLAPRP